MALQNIKYSWDELRIFLEVARHKTLSAAARQLDIDHTTVSRRVASLESSIGEALFIRGPQGFELTPKGHEIFRCVQVMESSALAITESVSQDSSELQGSVRLATMEGIASLYLAGEFVELRERHPSLEVELVTSTNMVHVNRREADLFLGFFHAEGRGLQVEAIGEFSLHLYGAPEYLRNYGTPKSVSDLSNHVFTSYIDDLVQLDTVHWLKEVAPGLRVVFHSTSMLAQMFAAAAGAGLVMLPKFARAERFGLTPVLEDQVAVSRELWLAVHKDLQFTPRVKAVITFMREVLQRDYPCR